jgi:hypothetical protein
MNCHAPDHRALFRRSTTALRGFCILALLAGLLPAVQGCLWVSGTAVAIWATSRHGDDSSAGEPALPSAEEVGDAGGPFLLLDGDPAAVALGDFIEDEAGAQEGSGPHLDAAVIFRGGQSVAFYRGDGTGRLVRHSTVPVSARTVALAAVVWPQGGRAALLVATSRTLEVIRWDSSDGGFRISFTPLGEKADLLRDLEILDLDGDSISDAAVSSYENRWVEFFRIPEDAGHLIEAGRLNLPTPPVSIAAAELASDPIYQGYRNYLAVLTEDAGGNELLLYLQRGADGNWDPKPGAELRLNEPSFALAKGGNHNLDTGNDTPDILFTREDGTGIVMVRPPGEQGICESASDWQLERFRGGGHLSPRAAGVALLHLPGGNVQVWDRATADTKLDAVMCSYASADGLEVERTISYPLPGDGRGLAAGDLNGDGRDDLVALAADPATPVLAILLANPPGEDPFRYPFSDHSGETPQLAVTAVIDVAFGQTISGEPFLATADRNNDEAVILFLEEETDGRITIPGEERYSGLGNRPVSILAGPFDGQSGDDVVVVARRTVHLLRNGTGEPRFTQEPFAITHNGSSDVRIRGAAAGLLDDNPYLDLVLAVAGKSGTGEGDDFAAVVLNPGLPQARQVKFYPTPDEPRRVALANLNGDAALDLLVSCDRANQLHILLGDPSNHGTFVAERGPFEPITLDGLVGCDQELEDMGVVHASADTPPEEWPEADWIVTSHTDSVWLYRKKPGSLAGSRPEFEPPCRIYTGSDPESLLVLDLFGEGPLPDLAILEESGPGRVVLFKHRDPPPDAGCDLWVESQRIPSGAPQHAVPFVSGGIFRLAVADRARQIIQILERTEEGSFSTPQTLSVAKANVPGGPLGMSAAAFGDGRFFAAMIVEDGDRSGGPAVDLISFATPLSAGLDLIDLGLPGNGWFSTTRLELSGEWPLAVLAGQFAGDDGYPDLLVCEGSWVTCYPGKNGDGRGPERDWEITVPEKPLHLFQVPVPLMDWKVIQGVAGSPLVGMAGEGNAQLYSLGGSPLKAKLEWTSTNGNSPIHQIAPGWLRENRDPRQELFIAILDRNSLRVEFVRPDGLPSPPAEVLSSGALLLGAVGCRDLNGDGTDDVVLVDDSNRTLHFFLSQGKDPFSIRKTLRYSPFVVAVVLDFLDANGDSKVDICLGAKSGEVLVFLGNGAGSFQEPRVLFASPDIEALATRDLDGDGRDEILVAAPLPGLIVLPGKKSK